MAGSATNGTSNGHSAPTNGHSSNGHDAPNKVIIVGGGSTGLALAQGLKKAGIPFDVYDKETAPRAHNWSMGLHWGLEPLQNLVPAQLLEEQLEVSQVDPHMPTKDTDRLTFVNGQTGELISELKSSKFYRVRRDKFRRMLMTGLEDHFHWGKELCGLVYSDDQTTVTARFADQTETTGCLLVATDGPHSAVRTLLLGDAAARVTPIDYATVMCYTQHTREHAQFLRAPPHNPLYQVAPHPDGYCAWLSLHDGDDKDHPESWTFFHYVSFPEPRDFVNTNTDRQHIAQQKALASKFVDPWRSVFAWMPDDTQVWYSKMRNWDPSLPSHQWDNHDGRATLAGDAAHPMTFQRGQGLNHALKDAFTLCRAIQSFWNGGVFTPQARKQALDDYESEMKARTGEEVRLSEQNSVAVHDWSLVMQSPSMKKGLNVKPEEKAC